MHGSMLTSPQKCLEQNMVHVCANAVNGYLNASGVCLLVANDTVITGTVNKFIDNIDVTPALPIVLLSAEVTRFRGEPIAARHINLGGDKINIGEAYLPGGWRNRTDSGEEMGNV